VAGGDAIEGAHARVRTQRGLRERFRAGLGRAARYDTTFRQIFREAGLPEDLAYLPHVESSFESRARSSAGACGLWQFTRDTGRRYLTIAPAIDERLDPVRATRAAADYLRDAYDVLGTWPLALTSYNHGVAGMLRAKQGLGDDFERIYREFDGKAFGFASKNFYAEFLAARQVAGRPEFYFPEGIEAQAPLDHEGIRLDRRATAHSLSQRYGLAVADLAAINPGWTSRAVSGGASLPEGTEVWLPAGTLARAAGARRGGGPPQVDSTGARAEVHVVRPGDTLYEIARSAGIPVATLRRLNDIPASNNVIREGQRLRLGAGPPAAEAGRRHVVRRGDTLARIAGAHDVSLVDLLAANRLEIDSIIRPGQVLSIPGH
jgi:membrane-bound lytic murein transglycosylase D